MSISEKARKVALAMPAALSFAGCSHLFYQPTRIKYVEPKDHGITYREVAFKSADGTELQAWFFPAKGTQHPLGTIVQFHGNAQNMTAHFAFLHWLTENGYNLFAFDYRGYGASDGDPSQEKVNEDALAAIAEAERQVPRATGSKDIILYGQSLGGAILLRAYADLKDRSRIRAVIAESTFYSYKAMARDVLSRSFLTWLFQPLACVLVSDAYSPEDAIPKVAPTPLLVIHGTDDRVVPYSMGRKVYELARDPKEFWAIPGGGHTEAWDIEQGKYRPKLLDWLERQRR